MKTKTFSIWQIMHRMKHKLNDICKNECDPESVVNKQSKLIEEYSHIDLQTDRKAKITQIDQTVTSIVCSSQGINDNMISRIISIQTKQECNWRAAINSLKFLLKYSMKHQCPTKAIAVFITEKTLLGTQFAEYLCTKYQQLLGKKIQAPSQAKLQQVKWGAYSLKQGRNKQMINKMYMKIYLRTLQNGQQQQKLINCGLAEFKLLLSQLSDMNSNMK